MNHHTLWATLPYRLWVVLLVLLLGVGGCVQLEGGVEPPTPIGALPTTTPRPTASPQPTAMAAFGGAAQDPAPSAAAPDVAATAERTASIPSGSTPAPDIAATAAPTTTASTALTQTGTLRIGIQSEPSDLLPYHAAAADERLTAPISELLFPAPLLPLNYAFTTTGVLERLPSLSNGDIQVRSREVYLDVNDMIVTEPTSRTATAQQIVITYRWNRALTWSDGVPVTAADSVFAYQLAQQIPLGEEANQRIQLLEDYQEVDAHTTRAFLKPELTDLTSLIAAQPSLDGVLDVATSDLGRTVWTPLPAHIVREISPTALLNSEFAAMPIGYGPYQIDRRDQGVIRLSRNPYYTGPPHAPDTLAFVSEPSVATLRDELLRGSLDLAILENLDADQFRLLADASQSGGVQVAYSTSPIWEHLDFNLEFDLLQNVGVRRAIAHAINRQAMIDTLYAGSVPILHSWIVPEHWAAANPDDLITYSYSPDYARELLTQANVIDSDNDGFREIGIDHDSDGKPDGFAPFSLTVLTTENSPVRAAIAEQFRSDMADIGINVSVVMTTSQQLFNPQGPLFRRDFELAQFAWIAAPDPRGFELWSCSAIPGVINNYTGSNLSGWCMRDANQAIISATTSISREERREYYIRHQKLFAQELPAIPLFQRVTAVMYTSRLNGLKPDPMAPITWNMHEWSSGS